MSAPDPSRSRDRSQPVERLGASEAIKAGSDGLRGTLAQGLGEPLTGAIPGDDIQLLKFHGIYQEDDRDLRDERRRQKLEPAYEFMMRLRLPGGVCRPEQWLALDDLAGRHANGTLRLTTRQTFQFHGVLKQDLRATVKAIDSALLDTIGACGDLVRGVLCSSLPERSALHRDMYEAAKQVSAHFLPRSRAWHEIWLGEERVAGAGEEEETILGRTYLPRKFKIAFAAPPHNDVDVFTHDLGFIAIADEAGGLAGFNVVIGGGMGRSEGDKATFPRLADLAGFCPKDRVVAWAEAVVTTQRDYGDRVERKHARLKYTIEDRGLAWFRAEAERRAGFALEAPRPFLFTANTDAFGWVEDETGHLHLTLFVENGRVKGRHRDGLRALAAIHKGEFRLTANQNLIVSNVAPGDKAAISALLAEHGLLPGEDEEQGVLRRNAMACVSLPTCNLAMAEAERYLPSLLVKIEALAESRGLAGVPVIVRMSGCPNGCSRPYVAEIGLSGRGPGTYNLYLGGGFHGERLGRLYRENIGEEAILSALDPLFARFGTERGKTEHFGDFLIRAGLVRAVLSGPDFHA